VNEYLVVLVTAPSESVGQDIASALLDRRLCACVNILPSVTSLYVWEGEVCRDTEVLLLIKTVESHFDALAEVVREHHPYDVPEIVATPIVQGSSDYLGWIEASTTMEELD
jgi:periplasmic divalent cation tolerance protein